MLRQVSHCSARWGWLAGSPAPAPEELLVNDRRETAQPAARTGRERGYRSDRKARGWLGSV